MLSQRTAEALASIQALLQDPEHEAKAKEFERSMREMRGPLRLPKYEAPAPKKTAGGFGRR